MARGVACALAAWAIAASEPAFAQELLLELNGVRDGPADANDSFGSTVAPLGDVDGDGIADLAVAADRDASSIGYFVNGSVTLFSGASGAVLRKHVGVTRNGRLGFALDGGLDVDGDGVGDYVASEPWDGKSSSYRGTVRVWSARTGAEVLSFQGARDDEVLGYGVALIGDVDGDACAEVVALSESWLAADGTFSGKATCWSGASGALLWTFLPGIDQESLSRCCRIADVTGDGLDDVAIGSWYSQASDDGGGVVRLIDGADGTLVRVIEEGEVGDYFGWVGALGDVDRDGVGDLLIGAPGTRGSTGRAYVRSGANGSPLFTLDGIDRDDRYGGPALRGDVDWNGDGFADFLVGAAWRERLDAARGVVELRSGRTGRLLMEYRARDDRGIGDSFGTSLTVVDDLNGDGIDELLVGASVAGSDFDGRAYVFAGDDLYLQANQYDYDLGNTITIELRSGTPGVLAMILLTELDGVPMEVPLVFAPLDAYGELLYSDFTDTSYLGYEVELQGFCQQPSGRGSIDSNVETFKF